MITSGIYKITSPSGRVYIGQSFNIESRWREHKTYTYNIGALQKSFLKYGYLNHIFDVIHELPVDIDQVYMDCYEQLYMDAYESLGIVLLNMREAGSRGKLSEETKNKLSLSRIGKTHSAETRFNMSLAGIGRKKSAEHRKKIGETNRTSQIGLIAGEKNPKSKLTSQQVKEIRERHVPHKKKQNILLAKEFGVSVSTIERVTNKKKSGSWQFI